jgi:tetratricopeptide (TPR) repeat protein
LCANAYGRGPKILRLRADETLSGHLPQPEENWPGIFIASGGKILLEKVLGARQNTAVGYRKVLRRMLKEAGAANSEWRLKMAGKAQLLVLTALLCALVISGCEPSENFRTKKSGVDRVPKTPAEEQKARLLKKIDRNYDDPEAHFQLGQIYQRERRWDEAEHHYNLCLSFDPVHWPAQAAKVKAQRESGDTDKAGSTAEVYINQVAGSAERSLELGLAFQDQDMDDYALLCYQQALQLAPKSAKIHRQIGYYYLKKKDKIRAKEYLSRSFQIDPIQPDVAYELGLMGVKIGKPPRTKENAKKLDKIVDQSGQKKGS